MKEESEFRNSSVPNPRLFIQFIGIPLIAFVLLRIMGQVAVDALPLTDSALSMDQEVLPWGVWAHFWLFLGALWVVYSADLMADTLLWERNGNIKETGIFIVSLLGLIVGFGLAVFPWLTQLFSLNGPMEGAFGIRSLCAWFLSDWGLLLLFMVGGYTLLAWVKSPFLAMVSPLLIAASIVLFMFMPLSNGPWWLGAMAIQLDEVQHWRIQGIGLLLFGCFMLNVLLMQQLEKSKDKASDSSNVWLLFSVDFSHKKLKYKSEEPHLADFPKFWWVPYFWVLVSAITCVIGLWFLVQGDTLLEEKTKDPMALESLNLYFQRYAFRTMLLGLYYSFLLLVQSRIQWFRIYRLLVEAGLLLLVF